MEKSDSDQVDSFPDFLSNNSNIVCKSASAPVKKSSKFNLLTSVAERYSTFETWPLSHFIKPYHLAKAGFVYTGYSDKVECVHCKIKLSKFEVDDIPMLEHTRWSPKCSIVRNFFNNNG